jgi:hypothetical protein
MMTPTRKKIPRKAVHVDIPEPAYEALGRLCVITARSQAQLTEIFIRNWEKSWLDRMNSEEKQRYLAHEMTFEEAGAIRQRASMASPTPPQAA